MCVFLAVFDDAPSKHTHVDAITHARVQLLVAKQQALITSCD